MNTNGFVIFCLILTLGMVQLHSSFISYFNSEDRYSDHLDKLENRIAEEKFRAELLHFQHEEFRQEVATLLPEAFEQNDGKQKAKNYPLRNLASVVSRHTGEQFRMQKARSIFEKGKKHFRNRDFVSSELYFSKITEKYPFSVNLVEAYFFLAEGQFQQRQFEACLKTVEKMLELYPESELTGFALLRMGKIYEIQDRREDAVDLYQTVLRAFPQRDVSAQASRSLRSVEL